MIVILSACATIQKITANPTEKLQRLEQEYNLQMKELISNSGISLQSSEKENVFVSMAKHITNAITSEGLEAECLNIGVGNPPIIGLSFLSEEKNKNQCIKLAGKLQNICVLQDQLQKTPYIYCSVIK